MNDNPQSPLTPPPATTVSSGSGNPAKWVALGAAGAVVVALAAVGATRLLPSAASQAGPQVAADATAPGANNGKLPPAPARGGEVAPALKHNAAGRPVAVAQAGNTRVAINPNVGTVESVVAVKHKGQGTGLGAVAGGLLGGVVGHQFGGGNGKDAMTVLGAVGGGVAGHQIERDIRSTTVFQVHIRMEDGSMRTVERATAPAVGSRVTFENGTPRFGA